MKFASTPAIMGLHPGNTVMKDRYRGNTTNSKNPIWLLEMPGLSRSYRGDTGSRSCFSASPWMKNCGGVVVVVAVGVVVVGVAKGGVVVG